MNVLKGMFVLNSPLSSVLLDVIITRNLTLDSAAKADILAAQSNYIQYATLTGMERQLAIKQTDRQLAVNELIKYYVDSDSIAQAIQVMINENTEPDKQTLFATYLSSGLLDSAQTIYNELDTSVTIGPDWLTVQGILLSLAIDSLTVFDIDSTQHATLFEIADKHEASLATVNARSILKLVFDEDFEDDFDEDGDLRTMSHVPAIKKSSVSKKEGFELIPNPASEKVTVQYNLPQLSENSFFELTDVLGKTKFHFKTIPGSNSFTLSLKELPAGIYSCRIFDEKMHEERKLVVTK